MAKVVPFAAGEGGGIPIAEYPLLAWRRPHDPGPRFGRSHDWQRPERSCCRQALMSVGGRRVGPLEGGVGEHAVTVLVVGAGRVSLSSARQNQQGVIRFQSA